MQRKKHKQIHNTNCALTNQVRCDVVLATMPTLGQRLGRRAQSPQRRTGGGGTSFAQRVKAMAVVRLDDKINEPDQRGFPSEEQGVVQQMEKRDITSAVAMPRKARRLGALRLSQLPDAEERASLQ